MTTTTVYVKKAAILIENCDAGFKCSCHKEYKKPGHLLKHLGSCEQAMEAISSAVQVDPSIIAERLLVSKVPRKSQWICMSCKSWFSDVRGHLASLHSTLIDDVTEAAMVSYTGA